TVVSAKETAGAGEHFRIASESAEHAAAQSPPEASCAQTDPTADLHVETKAFSMRRQRSKRMEWASMQGADFDRVRAGSRSRTFNIVDACVRAPDEVPRKIGCPRHE